MVPPARGCWLPHALAWLAAGLALHVGTSGAAYQRHLEPEGEAGRVVLLPVEIDTEKLKSIIPDIVFDIHQLK